MKTKSSFLLSVLGTAFAASIAISSAHAAGIGGSLTVTSAQGLTILDQNNVRITLVSGNYDARLSNQSRSMTLTNQTTGQQTTMAVRTGFPGNDLRNFTLAGAPIGQSFNVIGITQDITTRSAPRTDYMSCYYSYEAYGRQLVEISNEISSRVFDMNFVDASGAQIATFHGIVSGTTGVDTVSRIVGPCEFWGYNGRPGYPRPYPGYPGYYYPGRPYPGPGYPRPGYPGTPNPGARPIGH